jgi:hypothetical protein
MSAATKALAQKQKRQKQIVAVGSVILLGLVGFQLPRLMGGGGGGAGGGTVAASPATPGSPVTPGSPATPGAAPTTGAPAPTPTGSLPDTDRVSITPGSGQLISFGLFKSKDPFIQQLIPGDADLSSPLTPEATTPSAAPVTAAPVTPAPFTPVVTTPAAAPTTPSTTTPRRTAPNGGLTPVTTPSLSPTTVPFPATTPVSTLPAVTPVAPAPAPAPAPATTTAPKTTTTPAPVVAPTSVLIATNGLCELVKLDGTFPGSEDIFKVISIAKDGKSAKIAVVGGAYDSGASAVTLKMGEKLTLVNTADGTRYVLQLKSQCDVQTEPVAGSATVPTATVAPPVTTSAVTTPIVTDALDTTPPTG